jgi:hypothetical protein
VSGVGLQVGLVVVLMLVNAAFAGSEVALISLREGQLRRLEAEGGRGRLVARLARDPNQFLSTVQIGITLAGFLASAVAAVSLAEPLVEPLSFLGGAAEPAAVVVITIVLTYVSLVLGELAPSGSPCSAPRAGPSWPPAPWPPSRWSPGPWSGCCRGLPTCWCGWPGAIPAPSESRSPRKRSGT